MTPREVIRRNIEFAGEDCRIGFNFSGEGRLRDFIGAGCAHRTFVRVGMPEAAVAPS